jgi:hypothetical protein
MSKVMRQRSRILPSAKYGDVAITMRSICNEFVAVDKTRSRLLEALLSEALATVGESELEAATKLHQETQVWLHRVQVASINRIHNNSDVPDWCACFCGERILRGALQWDASLALLFDVYLLASHRCERISENRLCPIPKGKTRLASTAQWAFANSF